MEEEKEEEEDIGTYPGQPWGSVKARRSGHPYTFRFRCSGEEEEFVVSRAVVVVVRARRRRRAVVVVASILLVLLLGVSWPILRVREQGLWVGGREERGVEKGLGSPLRRGDEANEDHQAPQPMQSCPRPSWDGVGWAARRRHGDVGVWRQK